MLTTEVRVDRLDAAAARAWARRARADLAGARARIDAVNVFPVADSDTGTNALLTVTAGAEAVEALPADADGSAVVAAFARGALLGARGNSGVILSQFLAGFARRLEGDADAACVARGLESAARAARSAVADPQEGTVLTLADGVAQAASTAAAARADLPTMFDEVSAQAHAALLPMSDRHPVLHRAHVPDAGACALLVLLDALAVTVAREAVAGAVDGDPDADGDRLAWLPGVVGTDAAPGAASTHGDGAGDALPGEPTLPGELPRHGEPALPGEPARAAAHGRAGRPDTTGAGGAFEVMFVARTTDGVEGGPDERADDADEVTGTGVGDALRAALGAVGDSVAVVGSEGWWHAHVHTDEPAAAIAAGAAGAPAAVREQVVVRSVDAVPSDGWGLVVCTAEPSLAAWYASAGAVVLVRCPEAPVTAAHLRRAVADTGADRVVVLPGDAVGADALADAMDAGPAVTEVLGTRDELGTVVATLAFAGAAPGAPAVLAATLALGRLRSVPVGPGEDAAAALEALVGAPPRDGAGEPQSVTVLLGAPLDRPALDRLDAAARRHELELTLVGPAGDGSVSALGLD